MTHADESIGVFWAPSLVTQPEVFVDGTVRRLDDGGIFVAGLDIDRADTRRFLAIHRGQNSLDLHGHCELRTTTEDYAMNGLRWATSELSWPPEQLEDAFAGARQSMPLPGGPGLDALPTELRAALTQDPTFYDGEPHAESGPVVLRPAEFVVSRLVPVERNGPGDTIGVRVVDFTHAPDWPGSSADLLVWVPDFQAFAAYDGDHARLYMFPGATWQDVTDHPGRYLNAMWENPLYYTDSAPPLSIPITTRRPPSTTTDCQPATK